MFAMFLSCILSDSQVFQVLTSQFLSERLGIEYSGTTVDGQNVMGIVPCQGLATHIEGFSHLRWTV